MRYDQTMYRENANAAKAVARHKTAEKRSLLLEAPPGTVDFEDTLRLLLEAMVVKRLEEILERVTHREAANDGQFLDSSRLYRLRAVLKLLNISKSTLYAWLNPSSPFYDPTLPKPFKLGQHAHSAVVWKALEIEKWLEARRMCSSRPPLERRVAGEGA